MPRCKHLHLRLSESTTVHTGWTLRDGAWSTPESMAFPDTMFFVRCEDCGAKWTLSMNRIPKWLRNRLPGGILPVMK